MWRQGSARLLRKQNRRLGVPAAHPAAQHGMEGWCLEARSRLLQCPQASLSVGYFCTCGPVIGARRQRLNLHRLAQGGARED